MPIKKTSSVDPILLKVLKAFPKFVRDRERAMQEQQKIIARMTKGIVKEFKKKKFKMI